MPEIDLNKRIFKEATDEPKSWMTIEGQNLLGLPTGKRGYETGFEFQAGVGDRMKAILNDWAELDFFVKASVQYSAKIQVETPLNLFEDIGLIAKIQAIVKYAVAMGLEARVTVGEVIERVTNIPDYKGLPATIFKTIMEEIEIEGVLYGQAAVSVMAYLNLIIRGSLLSKGEQQSNPNFEMIYNAGYGFKFGGGFQGYVQVGIENPRRLVRRLSDEVVTEIIENVFQRIGYQLRDHKALESILKIAIPIAYEFGVDTSREQQTFSSPFSITEIVFHEGRRMLLYQYASWAAYQLLVISQELTSLGSSLEDLRKRLNEVPSRLSEIKSYLSDIMAQLNTVQFPYTNRPEDIERRERWNRAKITLWASLILYESLQNVYLNDESTNPFTGPIDAPILEEANYILGVLDIPGPLLKEHLLNFLLDIIITEFLSNNSQIRQLQYILESWGRVANNPEVTIREIFRGPFPVRPNNQLRSLSTAARRSLSQQTVKELSGYFRDQNEVYVLLEKGLFPLLEIVLNYVIPYMLEEQPNENRKTTLQEGISSALLPMIGRPLVYLYDAIYEAVQEEMPEKLRNMADKLDEHTEFLAKEFEVDQDLLSLMLPPHQATLRTIANILEQIPSPKKIHEDMKNVLTPIDGVDKVDQYMRNLERSDWIPQQNELFELMKTIIDFQTRRITLFSAYMIRELIQAQLNFFLESINRINNIIKGLIREMQDEMINNVDPVITGAFFGPFLNQARDALGRLGLPGPIRDQLIRRLEGAARNAFAGGILNPIKDGIRTWNTTELLQGIESRNLSSFSEMITSSLSTHLFSTLGERLGAEVSVGGRRLGSFSFPSSEIIEVLMRSLDEFPFNKYFQPLKAHAEEINEFSRNVEELNQKRTDLIRKYSYGIAITSPPS